MLKRWIKGFVAIFQGEILAYLILAILVLIIAGIAWLL